MLKVFDSELAVKEYRASHRTQGQGHHLIQILALRESSQPGKKVEVWFERGMRAPSVEAVFHDPMAYILEKTEPSERWNIYYTVADCLEEKGRKLSIQHHIPFDVDKLEIPEVDTDAYLKRVAKIVCEAIGVDYDRVGIVFSGNGLQFIVGTTNPVQSDEYFDKARSHYRAILQRIDLRLMQAGIKGKADPSVWSPARLMRYPSTMNRKPDKPERMARILQGNIERLPFSLEDCSNLPKLKEGDAISIQAFKDYPTPDAKTILAECKFMQYVVTHPEKITEPEWYAATSIGARFPDGRKFVHQMSKGHPKYTFEETEAKIDQSLESSGPRTCKNVNALSDKCKTCKHFGTKLVSPIMIEGPGHVKSEKHGFYNVFITDEGKVVKKKPDYVGLLKYFQRETEYIAVETGMLWKYNGQFFSELHPTTLERYALDKFDPYPETHIRREFVNLSKISNLRDLTEFNTSTDGKMNFQNGVFDVRHKVLLPHSKDYGFRSILPCRYDAKAACPLFLGFLRDVTKQRQELIDILQEFLGYTFANASCKYERMLMLLGDGSNGKSTLVKVIRALAGEGVSNLSIKNIHDNQQRAALEGKIVNIAEENSADAFKDTEVIKNIVSGGRVQVKRIYVQPYELEVRAKMIMLLNRMPPSNDATKGFFRRCLIIPFDQEFTDENGLIDRDIDAKLITELPGIFNWIMEGYERLTKNAKFTYSKDSEAQLEVYRKDVDPIHAWFEEDMEVTAERTAEISHQKLYSMYANWCMDNGLKYQAPKRNVLKYIRKRVESKTGNPPLESKKNEGGNRFWTITNVRELNDVPERF